MFTKNIITGVTKGTVNTVQQQSSTYSRPVSATRKYDDGNKKTQVSANLGGMGNMGGSHSTSANVSYSTQYQYMMTGLLPAEPSMIDTTSLAYFYRDIYAFDSVAGSAIDIQSTFPFSGWELQGLEDKELDIFNNALEQLNLQDMLPLISTSYLRDGLFCGSLVFDPKVKNFSSTLIHDSMQCAITPSPIYNLQPTIRVRTGADTQQMLNDDSPFTRSYVNSMPAAFVEMLNSGAFTLNPATTLYVPRKTTTDKAYLSYLHRILPMYLIEKTLFRGTLVEVQRRQRSMTHLVAGDDTWTPTGEELEALVGAFQAAEYDPLGGWVSTRNSVSATDLKNPSDFLKWTDMSDLFVPYKLRALGISEAFLSADASFGTAESAYSTFLESMNSYRLHLTHKIFTTTIFPLIAVANGLYKNPNNKVRGGNISEYLQSASNRANLKIPILKWHKSLEAKGEENQFDMLEKASEKGVPIPLKSWMAAAGIDSEGLEKDLSADKELRRKLERFTGKDTSHEGEDLHEGDAGYESPDDSSTDPSLQYASSLNPTTQNINHLIKGKRSILSRDFGESALVEYSKSGNKKRYVHNERLKQRDINGNIAKIAARAEKDPAYRQALAEANQRMFGKTTL